MAVQLLKRAVSFALALSVGVAAFLVVRRERASRANQARPAVRRHLTHEETWLIVHSQPGIDYVIDGAHKRSFEGSVRLNATLDADGSVSQVEIVSTSEPQLNEDAVKAIKRIEFTPATRDGRPVSLKAIANYECSVYWFGHQPHYGCETRLSEVENNWRVIYE
jgi:TonB family protein